MLDYIEQVKQTLDRLPLAEIRQTVEILQHARLNDKQVLIMGNGGSAATASHFACDLGKGTIMSGYPRFRVIALTDNMPLFSAYANDLGYDCVFKEQLASLVRRGDVVIGISCSGNSINVLHAIEFARSKHATTIGFVGLGGGKLKEMVDISIHVPSHSIEQVEDIHMVLGHLICTCLRQVLRQEECSFLSSCAGRTKSGLPNVDNSPLA